MYNQKHEDIEILKSHFKCAKCGDSRGYVLDFHHKDPQGKESGISQLISNNANLTKIKQEIDKCVILCANCHREFHFLGKKTSITIQEYLNTDINIKYSELISSKKVSQPIIWSQKQQIKKIKTCIDCGKQVSKNAIRCIECENKRKKVPLENMPVTREELKNLIRIKPFTTIAKDFGVTDNAIRKWCDKFNLPRKKKDINSYSNEQWNKI